MKNSNCAVLQTGDKPSDHSHVKSATPMSKDKAFPHVLKHSRVSLLVKNGCELGHAKVFVGHRSISSTMVYTQLNDTEATDAAAVIDEKLF